MKPHTRIRLRQLKLALVRAWAIFKSRLTKPFHRGPYILMQHYIPNRNPNKKGRHKHVAIPMPKLPKQVDKKD